MISLINQDTSFFEIEPTTISLSDRIIADDVISLSITEEIGQMVSGTLKLNNPDNYYSLLLRHGTPLKIRWGYKLTDPFSIAMAKLANPLEATAVFSERQNLMAFITSPSGAASENGQITYNCNFMGAEQITGGTPFSWGFGWTRASIISAVLNSMGIFSQDQYVDFVKAGALTPISANTAIYQYESNYKFLLRLAREWRCVFATGNSNGKIIALFAEWSSPLMKVFSSAVTNSFGTSALLDYMKGNANVKSYSWRNNAGFTSGSNAQISFVNGQVMIRQFVASTQKIVTYRLDSVKMQAMMKAAPDLKSQFQIYSAWMGMSDFQTLVKEEYFVPVMDENAPQGFGYELNVKMIGNPLLTAPMQIIFGKGFPDFTTMVNTNFWCRRVTHTIDRTGYSIDMDVVDALTATGGSFVG